MIIKYHKERIYNPNEFKNAARRAAQYTIDRRFTQNSLTSKASRLLLCIPGMRQLLGLTIKMGTKLIENFDSNKQLTCKEK